MDDPITKIIEEIGLLTNDEINSINSATETKKKNEYETKIKEHKTRLEENHAKKMEEKTRENLIKKAKIRNNVNLERLKSQYRALEDVIKEAAQRLNEISDRPDYPEIMVKLIAEGLIQLNESNVGLIVREKDVNIARDAIPIAIKIYKGRYPDANIEVKIHEKRYLNGKCAGGVSFVCNKGMICLDNVLNNRLKLAHEAILPKISALIHDDAPGKKHNEGKDSKKDHKKEKHNK